MKNWINILLNVLLNKNENEKICQKKGRKDCFHVLNYFTDIRHLKCPG